MDITLEKLRSDLRSRLAGYKLPTILRVVRELPKSASGKVVKRILGGKFFSRLEDSDVQVWQPRRSRL